MPITKQKELLSKVARKVFEEATVTSLGSTFHTIISFHLKQKFGKDPYEVLIENPGTFYDGLKEVLGAGAEAIVTLVGTFLKVRYRANYTAEEFVRFFNRSDETSKQSLSKIFAEVVDQEENRLDSVAQ